MKLPIIILAGVLPLLIAGCVSVPTGPSVMALPGTSKNFDQFRNDDAECRQYAQIQVGGTDANQAATDAGVRSAAVGTIVGAAAGAAMGGHEGAGVGAGTGLLVGSMAGTNAAQSSAYGIQRNYDNAYIQCMYAKGERVPVSGAMSRSRQVPAAPTANYYPPPPPPPGYMPPPPQPGYPSQ
ncbi:MAG: YMGG-like glycine zipper-containing protein [Georgfuchsia sp.]